MAPFSTSYGRRPCDGIGGTVKRLVAQASLQATTQSQILIGPDMFKWASENIPGVKFLCVCVCLLKVLYRIQPTLICLHGLPLPRSSQAHVHIIASFLLRNNLE